MQDRIGQLCGQFKLPTRGAQSVARFTAAGHGDALATFLEVLEQEAERSPPPAHQPAAPGVPAALGQDLGNLRARPHTPGHEATTGPSGPGQFRRARRQRGGLRTARHRQDPRALRRGPLPGRSRPLRPLRTGLPPGTGAAGRQARPGPAPASCASWTTSTFCSSTTWATCPRAPRNRRSSSP